MVNERGPSLRTLGRGLKICVLAGLATSAAYLFLAGLDLWPYHDPRHGYPGIPRDVGYALGTKEGVLKFGAVLFAGYGAVGALLIQILLAAFRKQEGPPE